MPKYKLTEIKGVIPAMITLFDENEEVDVKRTEAMVDFLLEQEVEGLYLTGSTGEGFLMTGEERKLVVETVVKRVNGRIPIIVHVGDIGTRKSIDLAKHAYECGADAVSSVPPFYWRFGEEDIFNYYKDIAEATPLPMVVYNIPLAGMMSTALVQRIAGIDNVQGLKFTGREHDEMGYLKDVLGKEFMIYSGCDEMAFSGMTVGADGIIGSFYNVIPDLYRKILQQEAAGNLEEGMRLQKIAVGIIREALKHSFPSVMRNMLSWMGVDAGYSRRPFHNHTSSELVAFKEGLKKLKASHGVTNEVAVLMHLD